MIKHVFLDLDDTVFDFLKSEATAVSETMRTFGIEPTEDAVKRYSAVNDMHWKMLERGEITRDQVKLGRFQVFLRDYGKEDLAEAMRTHYEKELSHTVFLLDGALDFLKELSRRYPVYLASNGILSVQKGRIAKAGVAPYFKAWFVSEALGYNKPDVRFFEKAFEVLGADFKPDEAVIFGDSLTSDVKGGLGAGLHTVWYNPHRKPNDTPIKPEAEVHDYAGFLKWMEDNAELGMRNAE